VIIYIYAFIGFRTMRDTYEADSGLYCSNLYECFLSSLNVGLRSGGGIGDALS
jgi:hypothetical protein